jgi:RNA polymerase sigma factor (sigma-70 family)
VHRRPGRRGEAAAEKRKLPRNRVALPLFVATDRFWRHHGWVALAEQFDEVLQAARAGAPWALEAIYRDLHPSVVAFLRHREAQDADDLAADVFVAVAEGVHRFQGSEARFRSWVFTIAYRRLADLRRRAGRHRTEPSAPEVIAEHAIVGDAEHDVMLAIGTRSALARIAALPSAQAEVILLRIVADLPVDDVAGIVGRRPGAVRALQHRALQRLARELTDGP